MHAELQEAIDLHQAIVAEAGNALIGYETEKTLANVVLLSEIPTTYDKDEKRQVNAGNLLLRGVPGRRQDVLRRHPRGDQRRQVRAHSGPRRSAADRGRRVSDDQPVDRRVHDRVRSARLGGSDPARRNQPHPAQVAERVSRRPAGSHRHRRQDDLRTAGIQLRDRDDEPDGARAGHVSAVGSRHRSVRDHREHRLPAARRRTEARQLRLQEGAPQGADVEGAHHRAALGDHTRSIPPRVAGEVHPAARRRDAAVQRRNRMAAPVAVRNGREMRGPRRVAARDDLLGAPRQSLDAAQRRARRRSIPKTCRISRNTSSATACGSAPTLRATASQPRW